MKAGFGWEIGAFESWDALGLAETVAGMKNEGYPVAEWVNDMVEKGIPAFYKIENGKRLYYNVGNGEYTPVPGGEAFIVMKNFEDQTIWKNSACRLYHLGDDVCGLEWETKLGTIGG